MVKTWMPPVAGILSIIAGGVAMLVGIGALARGDFAHRMMWERMWGEGRLDAVGVIAIVLGIVAIIGGIFAIRRQAWGLALAGAICALYPPFLASVLGILAIIFVALSRKEFEKSPSAPPERTDLATDE